MSTAADHYSVGVEKQPRLRRLVSQLGFWFGAVLLGGDGGLATAAPSEDQVVVRDATGNVVARINETPPAIPESMFDTVTRDLERLSATDFATEWGLGK